VICQEFGKTIVFLNQGVALNPAKMTKISSLFHHRFTRVLFFKHRMQDYDITVMRVPRWFRTRKVEV
jgi:hypothetical protein